jgi:hypothetical protein
MRNKIFGGIGILWGVGTLISLLTRSSAASGNSAYQAGHAAGTLFGLAMLVVGIYYFRKG